MNLRDIEVLFLHREMTGIIEKESTGEKRVIYSRLGKLETGGELDLQLELIGGNSHTGVVIATWQTTEDAESKIYWGIDPDNLNTSMSYNGSFNTKHEIEFPQSFVGSNHYFQAWSRTAGGQEETSEVYGIYFIPGVFEFEAGFEAFVAAIITPVSNDLTAIVDALSVSVNVGPDGNPNVNMEAFTQAISKPTSNDVNGETTGFSTNVTAVVT